MGIDFKAENVKVVPTEQVHPNDWNPKEKDTEEYRTVKRGIETKGLKAPIFVRTIPNTFGYEVVDGEQRLTACVELGFKEVVVYNLGDISEQEAKELTLWFEQQVPFNEIKLATLLKDMTLKFPDLQVPFTGQQLENYVKMADFNFDMFNEGDGTLLPTDEMIIIKVTKEQKAIIDQAIELVRQDKEDVSEGRALELICADYIGATHD